MKEHFLNCSRFMIFYTIFSTPVVSVNSKLRRLDHKAILREETPSYRQRTLKFWKN